MLYNIIIASSVDKAKEIHDKLPDRYDVLPDTTTDSDVLDHYINSPQYVDLFITPSSIIKPDNITFIVASMFAFEEQWNGTVTARGRCLSKLGDLELRVKEPFSTLSAEEFINTNVQHLDKTYSISGGKVPWLVNDRLAQMVFLAMLWYE